MPVSNKYQDKKKRSEAAKTKGRKWAVCFAALTGLAFGSIKLDVVDVKGKARSISLISQPLITSPDPVPLVLSTGLSLLPDTCNALVSSKFQDIYTKAKWGAQMQKISDFYSNGEWPPKARKSASGRGSYLGYPTQASLQVLRTTIQDYNVTTMIDIPCGDVNWIFDSWETDSLELYIGLDIVEPVIDLNAKRLRHHSNKVFRHWDGAQCPLPMFQMTPDEPVRSVDLVHSRDVLQHLPLQRGLQFLCHVIQSEARLLVTTTFPNGRNGNIKQEGRYYKNDLHSAPFDLPNATYCTPSHPRIEPDLTCVFDLTEAWVKGWIADKCSNPSNTF